MLLLSQAFSRRSCSKTKRNGTQQDTSGGVKKWVGAVSGRVESGKRRSLHVSTQASLFFRCTIAIAQITVHFVLLAERLEQAVLSLDKLSIKSVMQNTSDYCRYFLRVSGGATYYERGIERQNESK